ncbi:MAG: hypothetical protein AAB699_02900 [Patescibacteria group bacterium]
MSKKLLSILAAAFALNLAWEHLHSALYLSYQGGEITNLILFRAALFDAAVITIFAYLCFYSPLAKGARPSASGGPVGQALRDKVGGEMPHVIFACALVVFAVLLEKWGLSTGRWNYADAMPLIPLLNVGLTPAIQLGALGYISMKLFDWL